MRRGYNAAQVILADLGLAETPRLLVLNKMDLVPEEDRDALVRAARVEGGLTVVAISAADGPTTAPLLEAMEHALWRDGRLVRPSLGASEGEGGADAQLARTDGG